MIKVVSENAHTDLKDYEKGTSKGELWDKYDSLCHATFKLLSDLKESITILYNEPSGIAKTSDAKVGSLSGENVDELRWVDTNNYKRGLGLYNITEITFTKEEVNETH